MRARRDAATNALRDAGAKVVLHVPHRSAPIVIDGETNDPGWLDPPGPARTGPFVHADGRPAHPYSEARLVWSEDALYITLYAADEDIRSRTEQPDGPLWLDDSFRIVVSRDRDEYAIEVSPRGTVTDAIRKNGGALDYAWSSNVRVGRDLDGTLNDASDSDEEWVLELAIPFSALGLKGVRGESFGFSLRRCDIPKGSPRVCADWGADARGQIVLD